MNDALRHLMEQPPHAESVGAAERMGARRLVTASIPYGYGYGNVPGRGSFFTDGYGIAEEFPLYRAADTGALLRPTQTSFGIPDTQADAAAEWAGSTNGWLVPDGFSAYARTGRPDGRPRLRSTDPDLARQALVDALEPVTLEEAKSVPRRGNRSTATRERVRHIDGAISHVAQHHDHEVVGQILNLSSRTVRAIVRRS